MPASAATSVAGRGHRVSRTSVSSSSTASSDELDGDDEGDAEGVGSESFVGSPDGVGTTDGVDSSLGVADAVGWGEAGVTAGELAEDRGAASMTDSSVAVASAPSGDLSPSSVRTPAFTCGKPAGDGDPSAGCSAEGDGSVIVGVLDGAAGDSLDGSADGSADGAAEGSAVAPSDGSVDGSADGSATVSSGSSSAAAEHSGGRVTPGVATTAGTTSLEFAGAFATSADAKAKDARAAHTRRRALAPRGDTPTLRNLQLPKQTQSTGVTA